MTMVSLPNLRKQPDWHSPVSMPRVSPSRSPVLSFYHCFQVGFGRLCSKKKHIMLLAVLIFSRNYAKIMLLSENYALSPKLCYLDFTLILRKIKIISSITLSILTLMNIHIVHLPVLQSLAPQIRMCAPRKAK